MTNVKEEIAQFKRDLRSYTYHKNKIIEIERELEALTVRIQGVSSISVKDVFLDNVSDPYADDYRIKLMMKKEMLIKQRDKHLFETNRIENMLLSVDEMSRTILIDIYIRRKNIKTVAFDMFISESSVKRRIDKSIKFLIKQYTK